MTSPTDNPSNLLFGLIAFQTGIIDHRVLLSAYQDWTRMGAGSLAQVLIDRGAVDAYECDLIGVLVARHLGRNEGDPEKSLAAIKAGWSSRRELSTLGNPGAASSLEVAGTLATRIDDTIVPGSTAYNLEYDEPDAARYRILRHHAKGGLGVVYVAKDCELHREVALKEIQERHADDPRSRARFLLEAEITGGLEHPGIVPVYGLGCYSDGRPYYAMRFIRGDSLKTAIAAFHADTRLADDPGARSLELRKLLRRFTDVCDAIDYAHGRGVLHRDLKPGNVMVGRYGETLVVDWGLAKATGRPNLDVTKAERALVPVTMSGSAETLPGSAVGTPGYMSPEQAAGDLDRLGPASDVYSLGATLYTILTGRTAFEGDVESVLLRVQLGEFPAPRTLDPDLSPALEAICLKAMALRPGDRYPTPKAMSEDIERWMADEPVSAHRDSRLERARRWMRRRRTAVIAIAAAMVAAMAGLGVVLAVEARANGDLKRSNSLLTDSIRRERSRLDLALKAMETYYTGASADVLLRQPELGDLRARLLQTPIDFYRKLRGELESGGEVDAATLSQLAEVINNLAALNFDVGKIQDALAARLQVSEIARRLLRLEPRSLAYRRLLARSLRRIGGIHVLSGQLDDARRALAEALGVYEGLALDAPDAIVDLEDKAACLQDLGDVDCDTQHFEDSERDYLDSIALFERIVKEHPDDHKQLSMLAGTQNNLGYLYGRWEKVAERERWFRTSLATNARVDREHPGDPDYRRKLSSSYNNLASLFTNTNRLGDAVPFYLKALEIQQALVRDHPTVALYQSDLALSYQNLATNHANSGEREKANAEYRRALEISTRLVRDHPDEVKYQGSLCKVGVDLGDNLAMDRRYDEGEAACAGGVAVGERLVREHPEDREGLAALARALTSLAGIHQMMGRVAESEAGYREVLARIESVPVGGAEDELRECSCGALVGRAILLSKVGRLDEAEADIRRALNYYEPLAREDRGVSNDRKALAWALVSLGDVMLRRDRHVPVKVWGERASAAFLRAADLAARVLKDEPDEESAKGLLAGARAGQARALASLGRHAEALRSWDLALADSPRHVRTEIALGRAAALVRSGRISEGLAAADAIERSPGKVHFEHAADVARVPALAALVERSGPLAATALDRLARSLGARGRDDGLILAEELRDPDFDMLRALPDFRDFLLDLALPPDPFARP